MSFGMSLRRAEREKERRGDDRHLLDDVRLVVEQCSGDCSELLRII